MNTNLSLEGFRDLPMERQEEITGGLGFLATLAVAAIGIAVGAIIDDWDNFKNGLTGQPEIPK